MTDRESDTVRLSIVRESAQFLTRMVHQHVYPMDYRRVHFDDGKRFEVIVRLYKSRDDTQPVMEQMADRSTDA